MADDTLIGQVGEVVLRIRGGDQPGEITATSQGAVERFIAYADSPLDAGVPVLVIAVRGPRQVDVIALDP